MCQTFINKMALIQSSPYPINQLLNIMQILTHYDPRFRRATEKYVDFVNEMGTTIHDYMNDIGIGDGNEGRQELALICPDCGELMVKENPKEQTIEDFIRIMLQGGF